MAFGFLIGHSIYMTKQCFIDIYHTEKTATSGSCDGENAKKKRTNMIKIGTSRSINGGGGSGGNNNGRNRSDRVNKIITMIEVPLKYLTIIKLYTSKQSVL